MSNPGASPRPGVVGGFAPLNGGLLIPAQYLPPAASSPRLFSAVAAFNPTNAAEIIAAQSASVAANTLQAGSVVHVVIHGKQTTNSVGTTFKLRCGPLGTLADPSMLTTDDFNINLNQAINIEMWLTVRSIGGGGTVIGNWRMLGCAIGGNQTAVLVDLSGNSATTALATNQALFFTLGALGDSAGSQTYYQAYAELL